MTLSSQEQRIFLLTLIYPLLLHPKRTSVNNIGRAIVKKLAVKFEGNEILSIDNFDIFAYSRDLWKTKSEKRDAIRHHL